MTAPIDLVLGRLEGVKPAGKDRWIARCPAHDDRSPSLSIATGNDSRVLLHDHAGCTVDEILAAINLETSDLFERRGSGSEILETYPYTDEQGNLLFEVVRFHPKNFRQRRPDDKGGWTWKLGDTRRVPYRLPAVRKAAGAGDRVAVVEGERDVHTAEKLGLVATTCPGGSGKWRPEYSESLRGAKVGIVADRDEPGRKHAAEVAAALEGVAASVKILEPAAGKDLTDHVAHGFGLSDLVDVGDDHHPEVGRKIVVRALSSVTPVRTEWVWQDRIARGTITILAGRQGLGKSTLLTRLTADLSRGRLPGDLYGKPTTSLLVTFEDSVNGTLTPRGIAADADLSRVKTIEVSDAGRSDLVSLPTDGELVAAAAIEHGAAVLFIDPLVAALSGGTDAHRDQDVRIALAPLAKLAEKTGIAVVGVMHLRKGAASSSLDKISGSIAFSAAARSVLAFAVNDEEEDDGRRIIGHAKCNLGPLAPSIEATIEPATVRHGDREIPTARLTLGQEIDVTASELLSPAANEDRTEVEAAGDWLQDSLADGDWHETQAVLEAAKAAGIARRTLYRARKRVGVESRREGQDGRGRWRLESGCANPLARPVVPTPLAQPGSGSVKPISHTSDPRLCQGADTGTTDAKNLAEAERIASEMGLEI